MPTNSTTTNSTTTKITTKTQNNQTNSTISSSFNEVNYNGTALTFPASKASFDNTGLTWDEKYATKEIGDGFTSSGGRIGKYPGGIVVSVINNSGETKKIEDCIIDSGAFYNPKDNSENPRFIGDLNYNSTEEEVINVMSEKGYKNPKISSLETSSYYKFFKDDNENNFKDYIEFYFYNKIIVSVTISASVN